MTWTIAFEKQVAKEFRDLDPPLRRRVRACLEARVLAQAHPRRLGKALKGRYGGAWRYRAGDVCIICAMPGLWCWSSVSRIAGVFMNSGTL